jgi:FkbM family methyltransferase
LPPGGHAFMKSSRRAAPEALPRRVPALSARSTLRSCPPFRALLLAAAATLLAALAALRVSVLAPAAHALSPPSSHGLLRSVRSALSPPALYLPDAHCAPVEWAAAPRAPAPLWAPGAVFRGPGERLNFSLALPPREVSYVSDLMFSSGGMWAPRKTLLFISVLTSPKVAQSSRVVVDVGANLGYFSQVALGLGYEVLAFEPQPRAQPYLAATAARNGNGERFHLFPCAVGSIKGVVEMATDTHFETATLRRAAALEQGAGLAGAGSQPDPAAAVPMVRLADVLRPGVPVALLKINVERFERGVLAGLTPELLQGVRNVLVEMADAETRALIRRQLEGAGFFCRQVPERYTDGDKGDFIDTNVRREDLNQVLMGHLLDCKADGSGPEDHFFSREDFPWMCSTIGC